MNLSTDKAKKGFLFLAVFLLCTPIFLCFSILVWNGNALSDDTWTAVAAGSEHSLGIKTDGTLWAWGYNHYGQLGDGTTTNSTTPVQVSSSSTPVPTMNEWGVLFMMLSLVCTLAYFYKKRV
ncbi:hypothetical protein MCHI_002378 [Candidatus Magnetoovum chiemensis]|nr:hypothetical protein MCHI_002378 [Candidatus Magnetoovum chiemensis]